MLSYFKKYMQIIYKCNFILLFPIVNFENDKYDYRTFKNLNIAISRKTAWIF